jgi:hypothetical protein
MVDDNNGGGDAPVVDATVGEGDGVDAIAPAATGVATAVPARNFSGQLVFWAGLGSLLVALIGALGSGWGLWHFGTGFMMLAASMGLGAFAVLFGWFIGWRQKRKGVSAPKMLRWAGMALGVGMMAWLLSFAWAGRSVPAIHDISTDLADPPQFAQLAVRADNLDKIPGENDDGMKGMSPQQRWVLIHQNAYGDIRSVRINQPVSDVVAKAERLVDPY